MTTEIIDFNDVQEGDQLLTINGRIAQIVYKAMCSPDIWTVQDHLGKIHEVDCLACAERIIA